MSTEKLAALLRAMIHRVQRDHGLHSVEELATMEAEELERQGVSVEASPEPPSRASTAVEAVHAIQPTSPSALARMYPEGPAAPREPSEAPRQWEVRYASEEHWYADDDARGRIVGPFTQSEARTVVAALNNLHHLGLTAVDGLRASPNPATSPSTGDPNE